MKKIAIIGTPDYQLLAEYTGHDFIDLDIKSQAPLSLSERYIPKIYCAILRTALSNAIYHRDEIECVLAEVGEAKCDGARMICQIIKRELKLNVIESRQSENGQTPFPTPISDSNLPLAEKLAIITDDYISRGLQVQGHELKPEYKVLSPEQFSVGFWGVPPSDFELLKLFPRETRVLGWSRSVEARVPWSLDNELDIPEDLPIVFFAQSFCQKNSLARYLADKYNGLYIDIDDGVTSSTRAKLEAFLQLVARVGVNPWN